MGRAAARTAGGPSGKATPNVCAGFECGDGSDISFARAVLQVLIEERTKDVLPEVGAGVAAEFQSAEGIGVFNFLAVMPRAENEKDFIVVGVFGLEGFVDGEWLRKCPPDPTSCERA